MTSQPSTAVGTDRRAWIAPAIALIVLLSLVAAVLAVAALTRDESLPRQPGDWVLPEAFDSVESFAVVRASEGDLELAPRGDANSDTLQVLVGPDAVIDFLEPAAAGDVAVGDWLTVIGIGNDVRTFAIRMIVVISGGGSPGSDGLLRTEGGFVGHEAARESQEGPILGGIVTDVREGEVSVDAGEEVVLKLNEGAPLRVVRAGTAAEISDGDRVALRPGTDGVPDAALGVLVLVGGAR
ncbi:MAG: hypothetical protein ACE5EF_04500 [Dehalococcoidia bacterium]